MDVTPSASRLTGSLRDIGYDFSSALADLVDNSISAGAQRVDIEIVFDGLASYVLIADDGVGMTDAQLLEALRFGTRRTYESGNLGRYGLGLKTASISQCRRLTVATRRSQTYRRVSARTLSIDHIHAVDRWEVTGPSPDSEWLRAYEWLDLGPGTVVLWDGLDRVLPQNRVDGGWARRRFEQLALKASEYLGMVFHRFLDGSRRGIPMTITVNGDKVRPWNPFAPAERDRVELSPQRFEVVAGGVRSTVKLQRYVLPPRNLFSSIAEFERLSGPQKWNRQQGLYIYRSDRLIQGGGWSGIRSVDEHTKLARASLDFGTELDPLFQINVSKMRILLPAELRTQLERPIHELCHQADSLYRHDAATNEPRQVEPTPRGPATARADLSDVSAALLSAALDAGQHDALERIIAELRTSSPEIASALGW